MSFLWLRCCRKQPKPKLICPAETVESLMETTTLTAGQIQHLYQRYCLIIDAVDDSKSKKMHKSHFLSLQRFSLDPLFSTVLASMFGDRRTLDFVDFATYLSHFEAPHLKSKREQIDANITTRLRLLFNMYDTDKDGCIVSDDFLLIVHKLCSDYMSAAHIVDVAGVMMSEMDRSSTGQIFFADFCEAMKVFDMETTMVTRIPEA